MAKIDERTEIYDEIISLQAEQAKWDEDTKARAHHKDHTDRLKALLATPYDAEKKQGLSPGMRAKTEEFIARYNNPQVYIDEKKAAVAASLAEVNARLSKLDDKK